MKEDLIDFIIDNREYFKDKYKNLYDNMAMIKTEQDEVFYVDIEKDLSRTIRDSMSSELARSTGADMETIMIVLEEVNLVQLFK